MMHDNIILGDMFDTLRVPVIVCREGAALPVVFLNAAAKLLFAPMQAVEQLRGDAPVPGIDDILRFQNSSDCDLIKRMWVKQGMVDNFQSVVLSYQGDPLQTVISANSGQIDGEKCFFIYLHGISDSCWIGPGDAGDDNFLARLLETTYHETDVDETLKAILALIGSRVRVSRVLIFENANSEIVKVTYEWCAGGGAPAMPALQHVVKSDYHFDEAVKSSGMLVADDTDRLPDSDRAHLASRGAKAVAVLPLYYLNDPLGYIAFDDCRGRREWSLREIQLLRNTASIASSLINRRNAERTSRRVREVLQTVTDNLEDLVYISDMRTHELKFISKSMAKAVGKRPEDLIGKPCWLMYGETKDEPCAFCPKPGLANKRRETKTGVVAPHVWELHSNLTGKHYMVKDSVIKWIDGEDAQLTTAADISYRKQYEDQLRRSATTDAMTEVYNRQWGYARLREIFADPKADREKMTLCFIDIDDLKSVNDRFGHAAGDEMIKNTVSLVHASIRKDDFICRWGGDEFVLVLNCDLKDAKNVTAKITFAIDHFNNTRGRQYTLSISMGMISLGGQAADIDALVAEADRQMYLEKGGKKKRRTSRLLEERPPTVVKKQDPA